MNPSNELSSTLTPTIFKILSTNLRDLRREQLANYPVNFKLHNQIRSPSVFYLIQIYKSHAISQSKGNELSG